MLWKNAFVVLVLMTGSFMALLATCSTREERGLFTFLFSVCAALAASLFVPMPYFVGAALLVGAVVLLTWRGVPVAATTICVTAITPQFLYSITNVMGVGTLITLTTPVLLGFGLLISWALFPKMFIRRRWTAIDWVSMGFIVMFGILYSRGSAITTVARMVIENVAGLGGFYFAASRGRIGSPMFVLRAIMLLGVGLSIIAVSESVLGWLQFTATADLRGTGYPYLGSPYAIQRFGFLRAILTFTDSIACSIFLSMSVICAVALYIAEPRNRLTWAGAIMLCTMGTLATFSRTGLVVITVGLAVYLFLARRYVYAVIFSTCGAAISYAVAAIASSDTSGTVEYRNRLLELIPLVAQKNIVLGDNTLPYQDNMGRFVQGQGIVDLVNTYLFFFVNGGLVLLGLFIAILVLAIRQVRGVTAKRKQTDTVLYRKCGLAIILALYVGLTFTSPTDKNVMYLLFAAGVLRGIGFQDFSRRARTSAKPSLGLGAAAA